MSDCSFKQQEQKAPREFIHNIPEKVLFHPDITLLQLRIYSIVRSFMDTTGIVFCSNNWLAEKLGVKRNAVIVGIRTLVKLGFLRSTIADNRRYLTVNTNPIQVDLNTQASIPKDTPPSIPKDTLYRSKDLFIKPKDLKEKEKEKIKKEKEKESPLETQTTDSNEKPDSPITATSAYKNKKRALTKIPAVVESASQEMIGDDMINLNFEYKDTLYNPINHANLPVVARTTTNPPTPTGSNLPSTQIASKELALISQENHFEIEQDALESWLEIRKRKRAPVTPRVWKLLSKELEKFDNPHEAFDIMIMNGWSTIRHDWVKRQASGSVGGYDHTDTSWANKKDIFD